MAKNKQSFFDEGIDPECVPLIVALNNLKGVETFESCCGHLTSPYMIFFNCNDLTSLAIIARTFDARYSDGKWVVELETSDTEVEGYKTFSVYLHTIKPFKTWKEMFKSINMACYSLNYWNQDKFKDHFNGIEDKEFEKKRMERHLNNVKFKEVLETLTFPDEKTKEYVMAKVDRLYGYSTLYIDRVLEEYEMMVKTNG